jgi:hypothetical protein
MKKKFFLGGSALLLALIFSTPLVFAENVEGWLWGGGVTTNPLGYEGMGWISGNSENCDSDGNGFVDSSCGGDNSTDSVVFYAVNIPENDGNVTGYAWSEHYGWIDFEPVGSYPTDPQHSVKRNGDFLEGWARIVAIAGDSAVGNSGGWDGWIKMKGSGYGVDIKKFGADMNDPNREKTYAWSDELGWIDFSGLGAVIEPDTLTICTDSGTQISEASTIPDVDIERTLGQGNSEVLVAHYGTQYCDDGDKVDALWDDSGLPNDRVSLSDENGNDLDATSTVRVEAGNESGSEDVTVTYDPGTGGSIITKTLRYTVGDSSVGPGESPVEVEGFRWREVAP